MYRITSEYALLSVEPLGVFCWAFVGFLFDCLFVVFVSVGFFYGFSFLCKVMVRKEH